MTTTLGAIEYNSLGTDYLTKYPQLQQGFIQFAFNTAKEAYTMIVFYNQMAEMLFFSVYNSKNEPVQINIPLAEYPQNILASQEFNGYALYFKDHTFYWDS